MKNKKSGKMTIDKLAKLTQKGFEAFENEMKKEIKNEIGGLREEMTNEIGGLREEMHSEIGGLREEVHNEIGGLREEMTNEIGGLREEMSEKFDRVLTGQDQILKRLEDLETDNVMDLAVHHRHEDKLGDHEKRIVVLEKGRINI